MKTRITELLGIEVPVVQGAMARIADASLAGAVSEAGGLGIIACGGAPLSWVEGQVRIARSMTDKPIGANVMLMDPNAAELAKLLADLRVDVVTTGAGSPANFMQMWKDAGIKVVPVVASSALAARMERLGADAVVAEGTEAGGHIGELTTMALVPAVCDAVSIPVIAAGGIADGRGVAAAFALGAEGVQVGTRFLTVEECTIADAYKERVLAAKDADTIVTGRGSGHPVRCLKNKFARTVRKLEGDLAQNGDELEAMYVGSLRRAVEGDVDNGTMMAGQSAAARVRARDGRRGDRPDDGRGRGARRARSGRDGFCERAPRARGPLEGRAHGRFRSRDRGGFPRLLCSGQGSQKPGMGADLMDVPEVAEVFSCASDVLGFDVADLVLHAEPDVLNDTRNAQPAICVLSVAVARALEARGVEPAAVLGFSLGQVSALAGVGHALR